MSKICGFFILIMPFLTEIRRGYKQTGLYAQTISVIIYAVHLDSIRCSFCCLLRFALSDSSFSFVVYTHICFLYQLSQLFSLIAHCNSILCTRDNTHMTQHNYILIGTSESGGTPLNMSRVKLYAFDCLNS